MLNLIPGRLAGPLALAAMLFAAGVAADRFAPVVGANAQAARLAEARDRWRDEAQAASDLAAQRLDALNACEARRRREDETATAAIDAVQSDCARRIAAARQSAQAIADLVNEETPDDPNGCPVRQLVDPVRLRNAVLPPTRR